MCTRMRSVCVHGNARTHVVIVTCNTSYTYDSTLEIRFPATRKRNVTVYFSRKTAILAPSNRKIFFGRGGDPPGPPLLADARVAPAAQPYMVSPVWPVLALRHGFQTLIGISSQRLNGHGKHHNGSHPNKKGGLCLHLCDQH